MSSDRPDDQAIIAQTEALKKETEQQPLIGTKIPIDSLREEYKDGSEEYKRNVEHICGKYAQRRSTRGDGNCFYRAFWFRLVEHAKENGTLEKLAQAVKDSSKDIQVSGAYELHLVQDFIEAAEECTTDLIEGRASTVEAACAPDDVVADLYLVTFCRTMTSVYLRSHKDDFEVFLSAPYTDIASFCRGEVDPVNREADVLQAQALASYWCEKLGVNLKIVYLDQSLLDQPSIHTFPDRPEQPATDTIHLLYRPGHYDVIYPMSAATTRPAMTPFNSLASFQE